MTPKLQVPEKFNAIASGYDLLTSLHPGYHRALARSALAMGLPRGSRDEAGGVELLDLCCGTGKSTASLVHAYPEARGITGLDASAEMLRVARGKAWPNSVRFEQGDAVDPAATLGREQRYDGVFMAFGIRNVPDRTACLLHVQERLRQLLQTGMCTRVHQNHCVKPARLHELRQRPTLSCS